MAKFRKKPVVIEAELWHPFFGGLGAVDPYMDHAPASKATVRCSQCGRLFSEHGWVPTLEGGHIVCPGDWIICGVQREFYPCQPDIFKATYEAESAKARPAVVCLCGSTRFMDAFFEAGWAETLAGKIVLSVGVCKHADADGAHGAEMLGPDVVAALDELHLRKIDMADEVFILNVGGYIGESTGNELAYARKMGKQIRFLEPEK